MLLYQHTRNNVSMFHVILCHCDLWTWNSGRLQRLHTLHFSQCVKSQRRLDEARVGEHGQSRGVPATTGESTLPPSWPSRPFAPRGGEPPPFDSGFPSPPLCHAADEPGAASPTCEPGQEDIQRGRFIHGRDFVKKHYERNSSSRRLALGACFYLRSVSFSFSSENSCMASFLWLWASFRSLDWTFNFSLASMRSWTRQTTAELSISDPSHKVVQ